MDNHILTVYGTAWCGDCFRTRRLLDKYAISYVWIDIDRDRQAEDFVIKTNDGNRSVPTIVFGDGSILTEPSSATLLHQLGITNAR